MFGWLGKLFGTDEAIKKGIDVVSSGLDKLIYTNEEKAEDIAKDRSEARQMIIGWMANTQGQNLARRCIALVVTSIWVFMYLFATLLNFLAVWMTDYYDVLIASADIIGQRASEMNGAMMLILGFYFAAPHMGQLVETAINKFGGKRNAT